MQASYGDLPCFFVLIFITDRLLLSPWNILVVISAQSSDVIKQAYEGKLNHRSKQIFCGQPRGCFYNQSPFKLNIFTLDLGLWYFWFGVGYDRFSIENGNEKAGTGIVQNNFNL